MKFGPFVSLVRGDKEGEMFALDSVGNMYEYRVQMEGTGEERRWVWRWRYHSSVVREDPCSSS